MASNQLAHEIVRMSTEEQPQERSAVSLYLAEIGRKGGLKGGVARREKLSASRRRQIAKEAAAARWKGHS